MHQEPNFRKKCFLVALGINIRKINLGNSKVKDGGKQLAKTFYVLPEEEKQLQQMLGRGVEIFIQRVPEVKAIPYLK